jgi:probable rRNA maturation factor
MIRLDASNISRCYFLNKEKLKDIVRLILKSLGVVDVNLSIVFATDKEIRRLNYLYRKENRATDVLAFSMREGRRLRQDSSILGDIVISVDRAKRQAKRFNSTFKREIYLYIIHGILHLLGHNDESALSKKKMRKKETEILNALWEKVNY